MGRIEGILIGIEKGVIIVMTSLIISIVSLEVFCRYCLGTTLMVGIQEIAKWSFVWLATVACAAVVAQEKHIAVEYFVKKFFSAPNDDRIYIVTQCMVLFFLLSVIISGFPFAMDQWNMRATSTNIPKTFVYLSIPVSMSFMAFHVLSKILSKILRMRENNRRRDV
jgi:TRAP-type C4-dicarboxylate transport system permease small subunit